MENRPVRPNRPDMRRATMTASEARARRQATTAPRPATANAPTRRESDSPFIFTDPTRRETYMSVLDRFRREGPSATPVRPNHLDMRRATMTASEARARRQATTTSRPATANAPTCRDGDVTFGHIHPALRSNTYTARMESFLREGANASQATGLPATTTASEARARREAANRPRTADANTRGYRDSDAPIIETARVARAVSPPRRGNASDSDKYDTPVIRVVNYRERTPPAVPQRGASRPLQRTGEVSAINGVSTAAPPTSRADRRRTQEDMLADLEEILTRVSISDALEVQPAPIDRRGGRPVHPFIERLHPTLTSDEKHQALVHKQSLDQLVRLLDEAFDDTDWSAGNRNSFHSCQRRTANDEDAAALQEMDMQRCQEYVDNVVTFGRKPVGSGNARPRSIASLDDAYAFDSAADLKAFNERKAKVEKVCDIVGAYPTSICRKAVYEYFHDRPELLEGAFRIWDRTNTIPILPLMSDEQKFTVALKAPKERPEQKRNFWRRLKQKMHRN